MGFFQSLNADIEDADAGIEGYVVDAMAEQVPNWLGQWLDAGQADRVAALVREMGDVRIAIIKNLWVGEESRGRGLASELFDGALEQAAADAVLLACDTGETQAEGFDLRAFYERRDFAACAGTGAGPLMAWPQDFARAVAARLAGQLPDVSAAGSWGTRC